MKTRTSILIETEILKKAQELGINVSQFTENTLKQAIAHLSNLNIQIALNNEFSGGASSNQSFPTAQSGSRAGFEPATTALPRQMSIDFKDFEAYLFKVYKVKTARERLSYAKQYAHCLIEGNFSDLKVLSEEKRGHVLKALSALSKYLGIYQTFQQLVKDYGLKWSGKAKDALLIQRLTKVVDPDEVFNWVKLVKTEIPDLAVFMDFMAITGLRLVEAVESFNLIIKLSKGKLSEYYNSETNALENYKYKDVFIRRTKKSFIVFIPKDVVEKISCSEPITSANAILKLLQKRNIECRFGDIREAHASFLTRYLNQSEIDFLHGRIGTSVFMQNYFNPALISDLKQRVFEGIKEIQTKIS